MAVRQWTAALNATDASATATPAPGSATFIAAASDRSGEGCNRSDAAGDAGRPAASEQQSTLPDPTEPRSAFRRCVVMMVPRPWQGFRQALAEHGSWACQQPEGRPPQPGHRLYRTSYP